MSRGGVEGGRRPPSPTTPHPTPGPHLWAEFCPLHWPDSRETAPGRPVRLESHPRRNPQSPQDPLQHLGSAGTLAKRPGPPGETHLDVGRVSRWGAPIQPDGATCRVDDNRMTETVGRCKYRPNSLSAGEDGKEALPALAAHSTSLGRAPQCELESLPLLILPQVGGCRASSLHGKPQLAQPGLGKRGTPARPPPPHPQAGCWARAPVPGPRTGGAGPSDPSSAPSPLPVSVLSAPLSPSLAITVPLHSSLGGSTVYSSPLI